MPHHLLGTAAKGRGGVSRVITQKEFIQSMILYIYIYIYIYTINENLERENSLQLVMHLKAGVSMIVCEKTWIYLSLRNIG